jgi:hypothetical protein
MVVHCVLEQDWVVHFHDRLNLSYCYRPGMTYEDIMRAKKHRVSQQLSGLPIYKKMLAN